MSRTILIVDDDEEVRGVLRDALASEGYQAVGVANGAEALAYLKSGAPTPCMMFLDLMMPTMDGWQFRAEQKHTPRLASIPVVVMTANGNVHAAGVDAEAFIRKPFRMEDLFALVHRFCPPANKKSQ